MLKRTKFVETKKLFLKRIFLNIFIIFEHRLQSQYKPLLLNLLGALQCFHSADPLFAGVHKSASVFPSSNDRSLAADALSTCPCKI
jgi:hypothetical protein